MTSSDRHKPRLPSLDLLILTAALALTACGVGGGVDDVHEDSHHDHEEEAIDTADRVVVVDSLTGAVVARRALGFTPSHAAWVGIVR